MTAGLQALAHRVHAELDLFAYPDKPWVTPRPGLRNVVVVGGGQSGLAIAFALMRERIDGVEVLDASEPGWEGPWITTARMLTLRTLKFLTGPDLGVPSLTFRAWYEAQHGGGAYDAITRIPKDAWMRYLVWFRETLGLPVRNQVRLVGVQPDEHCVTLQLETAGGLETLRTRRLVIATGIEGAGRRRVPAFVESKLPRSAWAHTADAIDFVALAGRRVAVVGAGASAFDNAATALEAGASSVDVLIRRPEMPGVNAFRVLESRGFFRNFGDMPDEWRWRFMQRLISLPMPPPDETVARVTRHANARLRFASPLLDAEPAPDGMRLRTPLGWDHAHFLILGTGYGVDLATRPELAGLAPFVATWGDRHAPAAAADPAVAAYPYLDAGFALQPRAPGACPGLDRVHLFTVGAMTSLGPVAGGLNGMPWGVPRLADAISRTLFLEELEGAYAEFASYGERDPWEAVATVASA